MSESLRKASAWMGFSDLNQGGFSHFLGLRGPHNAAARVAPPIGSGEGSHLFSLGDCLGVGIGGAAVEWLFFHRGSPWRQNKGRGWRCLS